MKKLVTSIIVVLLLSAGFAYGLQPFAPFLSVFVLSITIIFTVSYAWKNSRINYGERIVSELLNYTEELTERTLSNIECPCGEYKTREPVFVDETLVVECPKCNTSFSVTTDVTFEIITEPLAAETVYNKLRDSDSALTAAFREIK